MLVRTKRIVAMASIPLLLLTGCQKEETNTSDNSDGQKFTIMATAASTADTKTTLGDDLYVSWQQGDAIDIACSNTGTTLVEFTADAAGKTVPFTCDEGKLAEFTAGDKAQYTYYGMYPAFNTYEWDGDEFRTMIPKNQAVTDGCPTLWDAQAAIAAGTCKGDKLIMPFKNAHALVKVVLPQWNTSEFSPISVMLMGGGQSDVLAADYWVKPNETGLPTLTIIENANSVRTVALTKSSYSPGETVYLVLPPGTAHGLSVFISSTTRTSRISTTEEITFDQNKIYVLDFSETTIEDFGDPVRAHPTVPPQGNFIIVSPDGSVAYYQITHDQSGNADRWNSVIFDDDGPLPNISDYGIQFVEMTPGPNYTYAVALVTSNSKLVGFLRYDREIQASYLIRVDGHQGNVKPSDVPESATIYTIYYQNPADDPRL